MKYLSLLKKLKQQKKKEQYISNNNITISNRPNISLFKIINNIDDDMNNDCNSSTNDDNIESISECETNLTDDNYPTADFYLDNLNTNIYSEKLTIISKIDDIGKYDIKANINYPLKKNPFYFGLNCEEFDVDKINAVDDNKDIIFMLDSDAFKCLLVHVNNKISNAEVDENYNEHIHYFKDINTTVELTIPRFYTFYIAYELFDSPRGELLFNNENIVVNNLSNNINTNYQSKVNIIANNWDIKYNKTLHDKTDDFLFPYMINNDNEINENPSKKIFDLNLALRPEIFNDIEKYRINNSNTYQVPFFSGDSISFKLTIYPDNTQTTVINRTKIINPLIYLITIKFIE
jgi:hypothetical protein